MYDDAFCFFGSSVRLFHLITRDSSRKLLISGTVLFSKHMTVLDLQLCVCSSASDSFANPQ